jgi:hypothetical protein
VASAPATTAAAAPSPVAMQLAYKLYDDLHSSDVFEAVEGNIQDQIFVGAGQLAGNKGSCPALQPPTKAFVDKMRPIFASLADPQFRQNAATMYAQMLSETELRDITNFMESPSGRKWNEVQPQVAQRLLALAENTAKSHQAQISGVIKDYETAFKAALATCPNPPASAASPDSPEPTDKKRPPRKK